MTRSLTALLLAVMLTIVLTPALARAQDHPRLFLTDPKVQQLRRLVQAQDTHFGQAYALMKARVEGETEYNDHMDVYKKGYRAREAALLANIAPDEAHRKKYAEIAFEQVRRFNEGNRTPTQGSGLGRGMMSYSLGLTYDWCHPLWSDQQRQFAEKMMADALDKWPSFRHANLGHSRGSNWVAVTRGGELLLMLGAGVEDQRQDRYKFLVRELTRHMQNGFGSLGVSQEGMGYSEYPGSFLLPAVLATRQLGDQTLWNEAQNHQWWKLAMYAETFQGLNNKFIQWGVGSGNYNEGWVSLLLAFAPEEELPYYKWFYDRHMGIHSPMGNRAFDGDRAGAVWALLLYPDDVEAKDPTGVYPAGAMDDHGFFFFRNRWKDENDILASAMSDTHHHSHAWDQPDAGTINLLAYNTRFFGGPGKERESDLFSALLIKGEPSSRGANQRGHHGKLTGKTINSNIAERAAYVGIDGGDLYDALGVQNFHRHYAIQFGDPQENTALISTLDRVRDNENNTYYWNLNLGQEDGDDGVKVTTGEDAGRLSFTLTGRNGRVKGWVLHPADAAFANRGDPFRIEVKGDNADIWVVMVAAPGNVPTPRITGSGLDSEFQLGAARVTFDGKTLKTAGGLEDVSSAAPAHSEDRTGSSGSDATAAPTADDRTSRIAAARLRAAKQYLDADKPKPGRRILQQILDEYPNTAAAIEAEQLLDE